MAPALAWGAAEGRLKLDEVYGLIGDIVAEDGEVVSEVEMVLVVRSHFDRPLVGVRRVRSMIGDGGGWGYTQGVNQAQNVLDIATHVL